jgi:hypothetical protein
MEAAFLGLPRLRSDIDLAGRILADDDDGQPGLDAFSRKRAGSARHRRQDVFRDKLPVDSIGHVSPRIGQVTGIAFWRFRRKAIPSLRRSMP